MGDIVLAKLALNFGYHFGIARVGPYLVFVRTFCRGPSYTPTDVPSKVQIQVTFIFCAMGSKAVGFHHGWGARFSLFKRTHLSHTVCFPKMWHCRLWLWGEGRKGTSEVRFEDSTLPCNQQVVDCTAKCYLQNGLLKCPCGLPAKCSP